MNPQEINGNQFLGKTDRTPRPSPESYKGPHDAMVRDQQRWDQAAAWDADNQQRRRDHIAGVDAKREQRRQADQAIREVERLAPARLVFLAHGGSEQEWERRKASIAAEIATAAAVAAVAAVTESDLEMVRMRRSGGYDL